MKSRLMKLAGLLKEEDFDLPDESPFETSAENEAVKKEITQAFGDFESAINAEPSQQYALYDCVGSRGDIEASLVEEGDKNFILTTLIEELTNMRNEAAADGDASYFDEFFYADVDTYSVEGVTMLLVAFGEEGFYNVIKKEDESTVLNDYGYEEGLDDEDEYDED